MDRVADIVLIIVGVILLILLVLGLAISCRPLAAEDPAAATATALAGSATPGGPGTFFTPTPTSFCSARRSSPGMSSTKPVSRSLARTC